MKIKSKRIIYICGIVVALSLITGSFFVSKAIYTKKYEQQKQDLGRRLYETHYNDRVSLFKEENKHLSNVDISFIGDSLTEGYDTKSYFSEYNVVNRGISGDTTFGVEKRLDCSAYEVNPKIVSLLIGANNFSTMLDNYESIVSKLKTNLPNTKIILCSLTSMTGDWAKNNQIARSNNEKIQEISKNYSCYYADLYNPLLDPSTNELKEKYSMDGGHLKPAGYEVITNVIKNIIKELL